MFHTLAAFKSELLVFPERNRRIELRYATWHLSAGRVVKRLKTPQLSSTQTSYVCALSAGGSTATRWVCALFVVFFIFCFWPPRRLSLDGIGEQSWKNWSNLSTPIQLGDLSVLFNVKSSEDWIRWYRINFNSE